MNEIDASLYLFANIEGGHTFWSNQVSELVSLVVYEKILSGKYDRVKFEKLITNLRATKLEEIRESIGYGVIKMNIDTDMQYAFMSGVRDYFKSNEDYLKNQIGNPSIGMKLSVCWQTILSSGR